MRKDILIVPKCRIYWAKKPLTRSYSLDSQGSKIKEQLTLKNNLQACLCQFSGLQRTSTKSPRPCISCSRHSCILDGKSRPVDQDNCQCLAPHFQKPRSADLYGIKVVQNLMSEPRTHMDEVQGQTPMLSSCFGLGNQAAYNKA
jgi:hypothetical protein